MKFKKIVAMSVLMASVFGAAASSNALELRPPSGLEDAKFTLKYDRLLQDRKKSGDQATDFANKLKTPTWLLQFMTERNYELPKEMSSAEIAAMLDGPFRRWAWMSNAGYGMGLALDYALLEPSKAFQIVEELVHTLPDPEAFAKDRQKVDALLNHVKTVVDSSTPFETTNLKIKDKEFRIEFLRHQEFYSVRVYSAEGAKIFEDGPRRIYMSISKGTRSMSSSMTETFTDPAFRNYGLYTLAIEKYLNKFPDIQQIYLNTQNRETVMALAQLKAALDKGSVRAALLEQKSLIEVLPQGRIDLAKFKHGEADAVKAMTDLLMALSLQGRVRWKLGWDFKSEYADRSNPFVSTKASPQHQTETLQWIQAAEAWIQSASEAKALHLQQLLFTPEYLRHVRQKSPGVRCERLFLQAG